MSALSTEKPNCPSCGKPFTEVDNTGEEMLNDEGEQTCLNCFHERFQTNFKKYLPGFIAFSQEAYIKQKRKLSLSNT